MVASGSFLVDAETRLNPAAGSIYFGGSSGSKGTTSGVSTVRPTTPEDPDAELIANLANALARRSATRRGPTILPDSGRTAVWVPWGRRSRSLIEGQPVFLCCSGCQSTSDGGPARHLGDGRETQDGTVAPEASPACG